MGKKIFFSLIFFLFFGLILAVLVNSSYAQTISNCSNISNSGTFTLTSNLLSVSGNCITINASDVTLDCNWKNIDGIWASVYYGIKVDGVNNTIIKNCNITDFPNSIMNVQANNTVIKNNSIRQSWFGITVTRSLNTTIFNNSIINDGGSNYIDLQYSSINNISDNKLYNLIGNTSYGIMITDAVGGRSNSTKIINNRIDNASYSIIISGGNNPYYAEIKDNNISEPAVNYIYTDNMNNINLINISNNNFTRHDKTSGISYLLRDEINTIYGDNESVGMFWCINCTNVTVKDNKLIKMRMSSVYLVNSTNNTINNITSENSYYGINLDTSSNNTVINSALTGSYHSIYLITNSKFNNISNNNVITSADGGSIGYISDGTSIYNTINNNKFSNGQYGIYVSGNSNITYNNITLATVRGLTEFGNYNHIIGNIIWKCARGMELYHWTSEIRDNNVSWNSGAGYWIDYGLRNFVNNIADENTINDFNASAVTSGFDLWVNNLSIQGKNYTFNSYKISINGSNGGYKPSDTGTYKNFSRWLNISADIVKGYIDLNFTWGNNELTADGITDETKLVVLSYNGSEWINDSTLFSVQMLNTAQNEFRINITKPSERYWGIFENTTDLIPPNINFTFPTFNNGTYSRNDILINVTATDNVGISVINISLYDSNKLWINSNTSSTSPFYWNISGLTSGIYYFNATANDTANNINFTETRNITLYTAQSLSNINFSQAIENKNLSASITYISGNINNLTFNWYVNDIFIINQTNINITIGTTITNTLTNNYFNNKDKIILNVNSSIGISQSKSIIIGGEYDMVLFLILITIIAFVLLGFGFYTGIPALGMISSVVFLIEGLILIVTEVPAIDSKFSIGIGIICIVLGAFIALISYKEM